MIYFDYCATTPLDKRVSRLMTEVNEKAFGNPSSIHRYGQEAKGYVEQARMQLASAINCSQSEIIFTGSGSESNNLVLRNLIHGEKRHVVLSAVEHPSISDTITQLEAFGVTSTVIPVDHYNIVDPVNIRKAIREETGLVTIMMVNNETGTVEPIQEIGEICTSMNVPFHCDAVQALGKIPIDVQQLHVTSMSFSAHKLYGPKGVGGLYLKKGTKLHPLIIGGSQEHRLRAGTENVTGISGFGLATEIAIQEIPEETNRLNFLRHMFIEELRQQIPNIIVNGHPENCLPGVVSVTLPDIPGNAMLMNLDLDGIAVSTGSACSSGTTKPSKILKAMGIPDKLNVCTLRISFGRFTRDSDVDLLLKAIVKHVRNLSKMQLEDKIVT